MRYQSLTAKAFYLLLLFPLLVCCGGGSKDSKPDTPPAPSPTIVNASISLDCDTQQPPSGEALMSDGTFETVTLYPTKNGANKSVTCADEYGMFDLVDCNGNSVDVFCLPQNFTCNYLTSSGSYSQELCAAQS